MTQGVGAATRLQHLVLPDAAVGGLPAQTCYTLRRLPNLRRVSLTGFSVRFPNALDIARCQLGRAEMWGPCPTCAVTFLPDLRQLADL